MTDDQRRESHALLARRVLTAYTRQRAECIRFLDRGRSVSEVADLLECHPVTVRAAVHRFAEGGVEALPDAPRSGRPAKLLGPDDRTGGDHVECPGSVRLAAGRARGGDFCGLAERAAAPRGFPLETYP
ncbi:helix-turn-helix domain-containing protein [Streptomyces spectabilis]|uniref:Helix-turn-helix domain-containing protein n=1 Tax=Streptomyces spectabilis TaxID=68270 RepID=A0A5P2XKA9_STRST|nr:helix-turn-helix domain-containing protein [Streptomyces spectabilis]